MDRGSEEEYRAFVHARYAALVRAAVLVGCRPQDAEDAVQDALVRCYAAWARVRAADEPDAYVYRVLVNGIRRSRRRRWWGEVPSDPLPEQADAREPAVLTGLPVRAALARLGHAQREVLVLRYFAGLTEAQIAHVLGVPAGTVKSRASRALTALSHDPELADLRSHDAQRP